MTQLRSPEWLEGQNYPIRNNVKENWLDLEVRAAKNSLALIAPTKVIASYSLVSTSNLKLKEERHQG